MKYKAGKKSALRWVEFVTRVVKWEAVLGAQTYGEESYFIYGDEQ
jgi:hypothetical protein